VAPVLVAICSLIQLRGASVGRRLPSVTQLCDASVGRAHNNQDHLLHVKTPVLVVF